MMLTRRALLGLMAAAAFAKSGVAMPKFKGEPRSFSRDWLESEAARLSKSAYRPMRDVPQAWRDLSYDEYKRIWFNADKALWAGTPKPFKVDFFHPGLYFPRPVDVAIVEDGEARMLGFDYALFDKTDTAPDLPLDDSLGYSGLRLRAELRAKDIFEEFAVFQGASYFRAIGTGQTYGLSARGLAIDTAKGAGEEFPEFTHFWLEAPAPDARMITVHALLNSSSVTGAYTFKITPGRSADMDVTAKIFPRKTLDHVGLAPLTSMFLFDETNRARFDDFRSAVHDSEGLMVHNGAGELLWRPLGNPRTLQVSSFVDDGPQGFGLMQRARRAEDFADLEALYHNRPSLWITPSEDWGKGAVTLVEIPSEKEIYDNIVAYWRPRSPLEPGRGHMFSYKMAWGAEPPRPRDVAAVLNTRIGKGYDKTVPYQIITVDFADHIDIPDDLDLLTRHISVNRGTVSDGVVQRNPGTGGLRLAFKYDPGQATAADLRAQLFRDGTSLTEVWLYRWTA